MKIETDRGEILAEAIVQFCGQVVPLRFLDLDDPLRYGLQLFGMNSRFGLGAFARRNIDHRGACVKKRPVAIAHCRNPQERVKHRPVFADQRDLDL